MRGRRFVLARDKETAWRFRGLACTPYHAGMPRVLSSTPLVCTPRVYLPLFTPVPSSLVHQHIASRLAHTPAVCCRMPLHSSFALLVLLLAFCWLLKCDSGVSGRIVRLHGGVVVDSERFD